MRIEESGLSTRAINALRRGGIMTLEEAQALPLERLTALRGVGELTAQEIITGKPRKIPRPKPSLLEVACGEYCRFRRELEGDALEEACAHCPIRRRLSPGMHHREEGARDL